MAGISAIATITIPGPTAFGADGKWEPPIIACPIWVSRVATGLIRATCSSVGDPKDTREWELNAAAVYMIGEA